jgi:hypothetical protein
MSRSIRVLIATIVIIFLWLPLYVLVAWRVGRYLPDVWYIGLAYDALAGTLWIVPIGLALPWMYRGASKK